ncbi:hypothetical protein JMJ77_0006391 [Colletotrichum scovillei]|uniref:Uncharacterized protein n=1 Tax=Colletotrichum scovillei TaxID=1209932 RepID=A0A9P7UJJ8_9PEZI|nr:hypothetical protein JMJ77_0006391 [Colletotrichum scovillei]KAG7077665.1 hypothetical protein JMJ76_0014910 [Colletotrichum scovillei]KAG7084716.1 hypothetical protein JMJ78_0010149 [Colletotrichum scovillei]
MKFIQVFAIFASMAIAAPLAQEARTEAAAGLEARQGCQWDPTKPLGGCP